MSPASVKWFAVLLGGGFAYVGSGPKGKTVTKRVAGELVDAHLAYMDVDGGILYCPPCDRCRARCAPNALMMDDVTGNALCNLCTHAVRVARGEEP